MKLTADLRSAPGEPTAGEGAQWIGLHDLAALVRRPGQLVRSVRREQYEALYVLEDPVRPSAVQAVLGLALSLARTSSFVVAAGGAEHATGRLAYASRALARLVVAIPAELAGGALLARRARRAAARPHTLARGTGEADRVLYLRAEPSLRWMGRYVGGAATHTSGVINGFAENGLEVVVYGPERLPDVAAETVEVPPRRYFHLVRGLSYTDYGEQILQVARSAQRPSFVYQRYMLGSLAALELAETLEVPLVQEFNGSEIWVERNWGSGSLRMEALFQEIELRNLRDASLVVVVSAALRDQVVELGVPAERILVNPNGVDLDRLAPHRGFAPAAARDRAGLDEALTVGFIGTFGLWHGVKLLPAIIDALSQTHPQARWVLVGDGELKPEVEAEIERRGLSDRVLMTGLVPHDRAVELLAASDVFVSPHVPNPDGTPFFGSPTKLFEYMGLRRPIVASDLDQIGEIIEHERTGLLVAPGDVPATAAAVGRLLDDAQLRERLAGAALEAVEAQYTWQAHTARILASLRSAAP